jgi:exodeoxyribonuclease VII large subunit
MQLDFDLRAAPAAAKAPPEPAVLTVGSLTRRIRELLENGVGQVWVEGEISNLRRQPSGHMYFTLKDASSQLACVLFAGQSARIAGVRPADGAQVQAFGDITVYEARGNYQLIVRQLRDRGLGALQAKFEELKRRLEAEGLFDPARKRPLPKFPRRIAVVTSPAGAAIRDFLNVLHRRQRGIEVLIHPVRVQGKGAAAEIAEAIAFLGNPANGLPMPDVVVVTRGGGSLEDLWEFNEEAVARAVAASPIPVVSAVGHEIDFTICDFAADFRAPTPSAAAEILSADSGEILEKLGHLAARLLRPARAELDRLRNELASLRRTALFLEPERRLREARQTLDSQSAGLQSAATSATQSLRIALSDSLRSLQRHDPAVQISRLQHSLDLQRQSMERHAEKKLRDSKSTLERQAAVLEALNPNAALARGYTITTDASGKILRNAAEARAASLLKTKFPDGTVESRPLP